VPDSECLTKTREKERRSTRKPPKYRIDIEDGWHKQTAVKPANTGDGINENAQPRRVGRLYLVVEYSSSANTHPVGVRRAVPSLSPNEEYGVHPRICSNHLSGSENSVPVRVSIACANTVALTWN
jgi:hypothetical protein